MKGKKAGIFAAGLVLGMIIIMGIAWNAFSTTNRNIKVELIESITPINYKNMHNNFALYIDESAKLSASQAFYEIAKKAAIDKENQACNIYPAKNYFILSQDCKPEQEFIESEFIEEYNRSFYNFIKNYPEKNLTGLNYVHILEEEKVKSITQIKTLSSIAKATFATYNISYNFDASTILDLKEQEIDLKDFEIIYQETSSAITRCQEEKEDEIVSCVKNSLIFDKWTSEIKKEGSYLIFELKTKRFFFFENTAEKEKFAPIELNFAIII